MRYFFPFLMLLSLILGCADSGETTAQSATIDTLSNCTGEFTDDVFGSSIPLNHPIYGGDELAQSFQAYNSLGFDSIYLKLRSQGSVPEPGSLVLTIVTSNVEEPSGIQITNAFSEISASDVTEIEDYVRFGLSGTVQLEADTTYWLVLRGNYSNSATDYIEWMSNPDDAYALGKAKYETSTQGDWQDTEINGYDFLFKIGCF